MVTGINIPIKFHRQFQPTGLFKDAQPGVPAHPDSQGDIEDLHVDPADILPHPFIKNLNQEGAILRAVYRAGCEPVALLVAGWIVTFHDRDKLHEAGTQLIAQESVNFKPVVTIRSIDASQRVEIHPMLFEQLRGFHHPIESRLAALVLSIRIVEPARAVDTQTDQKMVPVKELTPIIVEQHSVGLKGILNAHARLAVFRLKFDRLLEKRQSHQGRLAALPNKSHFRNLLCFDILAGICFQQIITHAETCARIQLFFFKIEAVLTVQVADGATRFHHEMERRRSRGPGKGIRHHKATFVEESFLSKG